MITVAKVEVDKSPLEIRACSEIQDMVSTLSYLEPDFLKCLRNNFFVSPKILHKSVEVKSPKNGTMLVVVGERRRIIFGKMEELVAHYILANQYQRGENSCKYCKRQDSRCQIKGFLIEMETMETVV